MKKRNKSRQVGFYKGKLKKSKKVALYPTTSQWIMLTVNYNPSSINISFNGIPHVYIPLKNKIGTFNCWVSPDNSGSGTVTKLGIWNRILDDKEREKLYSKTFKKPTGKLRKGLKNWWGL